MADFCEQCTYEFWGGAAAPSLVAAKLTNDFAWIGRKYLAAHPGAVLAPDEGFAVICEGCGPTMVGLEGECRGECLNKTHGSKAGSAVGRSVAPGNDSGSFGDGGHVVRNSPTSRPGTLQRAGQARRLVPQHRSQARVDRAKQNVFASALALLVSLLILSLIVYLLVNGVN